MVRGVTLSAHKRVQVSIAFNLSTNGDESLISGNIRIRAAVMSMVMIIVSINSHLGSRS